MAKILYIDDDHNSGFLAATYLKRYNHQVIYCENTQKAREFLNNDSIDLIISDIGLPGENGIEFYSWLQNDPQYRILPFIFTSAHAMGFDNLLLEHKDQFIPKPIFFPDLINLVGKLLKKSSG